MTNVNASTPPPAKNVPSGDTEPAQVQRLAMLAKADSAISGEAEIIEPLARLFADRGHNLYLVGGPVRDALLGRLGHDLDFTTDARPETTREILTGWADALWGPGLEFGTLSAEKAGRQIEITTFRSDSYDQVSRNPEVTFGDSLEGDLIRRDFRVNAMAVQLHGDGTRTFLPAGWLRRLPSWCSRHPRPTRGQLRRRPLANAAWACRFASQLGFDVSERTRQALVEMAPQIKRITAERINAELNKLIGGHDPSRGIDMLVDSGLAELILPEVSDMRTMQDEHRQHKNVYQHSLQVMRQAIDQEEPGEVDLVLRWAALLHDCGKPATRAFNDNGGVTFHQHEVVGAKLVRRRLKQLKFPKRTIQEIAQLVYLHMRFYGYSEGKWTDSAVRRYVTDAGAQLEQLNKLVRADCTTRNRRKAARLARACDDLEARIAELKEKEDLAQVRPDLDGNEIMEILDLKPGRQVGQAWNYLKELRLESCPMPREDAILALKHWWVEQEAAAAAEQGEQGEHA